MQVVSERSINEMRVLLLWDRHAFPHFLVATVLIDSVIGVFVKWTWRYGGEWLGEVMDERALHEVMNIRTRAGDIGRRVGEELSDGKWIVGRLCDDVIACATIR